MASTPLNLQFFQPTGPLSKFVQGIWSAFVSDENPVVKPLYSDAGSGVIFNFASELTIGNETLSQGVIMLPVKKQAEHMVLLPGAQLAGLRFHPGVGYGVLGEIYEKPTLLAREEDRQFKLYQVYDKLRKQSESGRQINILYEWVNNLNVTKGIPGPLEKALDYIEQDRAPGQLNEYIELSQRQIERLFNLWLGMPPKHYQRITRVRKTIRYLQQHKGADLAGTAQEFGFSDQAHMTREFRAVACITPKKI